jgi:hypothetical protein
MTFGPHGIFVHILITGQKICRLRRCQGKGKEMLQEKKRIDKSFRVSCSLLVCFHAILQIATTLLDLSAKGRKSHEKKALHLGLCIEHTCGNTEGHYLCITSLYSKNKYLCMCDRRDICT